VEVIPAVDLKDGQCVRLKQGEYAREVVYSREPVEMARYWQNKGASRLHLVDLDGAREGKPENLDLIREIVRGLTIPIQLGGGIRSLKTIELYLESGVERVILGTIALEQPELVRQALDLFGKERIVIGVDARDGMVAVRGWLQTSNVRVDELILKMKEIGVTIFIYTDISRDGMLTGPDIEGLCRLNQPAEIELIASGGISSFQDLKKLSQAGIKSAIIGKALYTGDIKPDFAGFSLL
jgi:phosphoribosylformimino-5-aminoimidazole carboxamide ribotide isomerase